MTSSGTASLDGRTVVLGVTGGIAAYKAIEVCRRLTDAGARVAPILTDDATRFVTPFTFTALATERARTGLFDSPEPSPHTDLGRRADLVIVAPATARFLAAYANGLSTDLLTATLLMARCPILVCPAMHTEMWEHQATQRNVEILRSRGVEVLDPDEGPLAGGDVGAGRLPEPSAILDAAFALVARARRLAGRRVVVTAGGTREAIDPVRFVGNRSSGKQGTAVAVECARQGAAVTLITTVDRPVPSHIDIVRVESAAEMLDAVLTAAEDADAVVMAAAVADFRPKVAADTKLKKEGGPPEVILEPTADILAELGRHKRAGQILVGFAAETHDLLENARAKLRRKNLDLIVANDVSAPRTGFEHDTNAVTLLSADGSSELVDLTTKTAVAGIIVDRVADLIERATNGE